MIETLLTIVLLFFSVRVLFKAFRSNDNEKLLKNMEKYEKREQSKKDRV